MELGLILQILACAGVIVTGTVISLLTYLNDGKQDDIIGGVVLSIMGWVALFVLGGYYS